ncbi:LOW QUALITY PROTEIN: centrosomal protein 15 [Spinachia spinachia]
MNLGHRVVLLQQLEGRGDQLHRQQQAKECEAGRHRNSALLQVITAAFCKVQIKKRTVSPMFLQDLQRIEDRLRGTWQTHPLLLALETRYWAFVEESLPAWELFFLSKGPHPAPGTGQPARRARLPPRPRPRTGRLER